MVKGLSKVVALSWHIEKGSVLDLIFDPRRSELDGVKRQNDQQEARSGKDKVHLATLTSPVTAQWVLNQLARSAGCGALI